ncbi:MULTISPECIES: sialate O-acetylesterase [Enterococcus]|uniref:sialate O-acetylesterase n=1 Tax=Enterococcus TaxID=1350 RepID=UPI000ED20F22|nr:MULTISPECIES: sialate O-acetylesterase [Enterococcus]HCM87598.1 hypothetical protein [Enterococcus sp.]
MLNLNPLLTDNVVLQAEHVHLINGMTVPYHPVLLSMGELTLNEMSNSEGEFVFTIPAQSYGVTEKMRIEAGKEKKEIIVQYGDVFLFAGQSNMEYPMSQEAHFNEEHLQITEEEPIFFYVVPMPDFELKLDEVTETNWAQLKSDNLGKLSAVAYYAMKEYQKKHPGRIIGAVVCSKGGTSAGCWISSEDLENDAVLNEVILAPFIKKTSGKEKAFFDTEFTNYLESYQDYVEKKAAWVKKHPELTMGQIKEQIGHSPWPPPANPYLFNRPSGLYQKMFMRITPFTFSSVIWYQGEEDTMFGPLYENLLDRLINRWRMDLKTQVPFYIVQLPICADKLEHDWASVRAVQTQASQKFKNVFLVTSLDCGEVEDIHPTEKAVLGKRIGEILDDVYYPSAPVAKVISWTETKVVIEVDEAASLNLSDKSLIKTDARIKNISVKENRLIVDTIQNSQEVQYAWENAPFVGLFNEVGYPVAPFKFVNKV